MSNIFTMLCSRLRYRLVLAFFHLRFGIYQKIYIYWKVRAEITAIERRLRKKGCDNLHIIKAMSRFGRMKNYLTKKENKEAYKMLSSLIAEWSDNWGIPQWQIRAKLQRDFDLDV